MNANHFPLRLKRVFYIILSLCLFAALFLFQSSTILASVTPSIGVIEVVPDAMVTIALSNLPKNTQYYVQMGERGTGGIGGYLSAGFTTGDENYSAKTFSIPTALYGEALIDVRITTTDYKTVATTFFTNTASTTTTGTTTTTTYSSPIPTTTITSVTPGETVTLITYNFPKDKEFVATMGLFGTRGVGGVEVGQFNSAGGGSFELTFEVPESLQGEDLIAIRLQTPDGYYYAYDWFRNVPVSTTTTSTTTSTTVNAGYVGYPTTTVVSVDEGVSVELTVYNLPKEVDFIVTMGEFGTRGVGGTKVDEFNSGAGGTQTFTFDVPAALSSKDKIAIRIDSGIWYAFDWFVNNTSASATTTTTTTSTSTWGKIPSTTFVSLNGDNTVTFMAYDFEPGTDWIVTMGDFGTRGVDGTVIQTVTSVEGAFTITSGIPVSLQDNDKVAIRFEQVGGPYYAFDWFQN